jgi:hypothetical protein
MSPKEFHAMNKCYRERMEHLDWQMAGVKAVYANVHGVKITAAEFMGKREQPDTRSLQRDLTVLFGCGPEPTNRPLRKV